MPGGNYAYTHSPAGNITAKNTEHGNYAYQYDELYRLTDAVNPASDDETYTYDAIGNRLTAAFSSQLSADSYTYNANNELTELLTQNSELINYSYDDDGNMTQKTVGAQITNYIYDIQDRMIRVEDGSSSVIAEYYYDPFGRRLWKDVGGNRTYYFYSEEGLSGEYDASGTEIKTYGYGPDSTWGTNPMFQKVGISYYWYINDHLGTPQVIIDTTGRVVWAATYDSFGNAQISTEDITNNLRFAGQYYDGETGLHYNLNRYYDPTTGRYTRVDPIGFAGGDLNLYAYVWSNPLNSIDSTGLEPPPSPYSSRNKPFKPFKTIVQNNVNYAHDIYSPFTYRNLVKSGGVWDYKYQIAASWEAFGNYNFGATGAATGLFTLV